jgi:sterol desaturase/sphingolipid hydroxylase (fatty acid hydroxylase superfamily)
MGSRKVTRWVRGIVVAGGLGALLWLELRRPLRKSTESKLQRVVRNTALGVLGSAAIQFSEEPIVARLLDSAEERQRGIVSQVPLPPALRALLVLLLFDYTMYLWHVFTHRVPWLWRFHLVHHTDLDLDVSTALRFHFTELLLSTPFRVLQILLIGPNRFSFSLWQTLFLLSVLFHHANLRIPIEAERRLNYLLVTPRMHGVHHSMVQQETEANWSSGLTVWDWLHGTLRLNVPQKEITIGVPGYPDAGALNIRELITMPFHAERPSWELPDGRHPTRPPLPAPRTLLAE